MSRHLIGSLLLGCAMFSLSACGGGSGGGLEVASVPPPPPPPPPPPAPPPPASIAPLVDPPKGVTTTTQLTSIAGFDSVTWNADLKAYQVTFASEAGKIVPMDSRGLAGTVVTPSGSSLVQVNAETDATGFQYTRYGQIETLEGAVPFAFGLATSAGSVPTSGTATYDAQLIGHAGQWGLYGTAQFQFDFGAGTLSGYMDPHTNGPMESPFLPRYTFTQTVFSPGSTTFSGSFDFSGPTPSSFTGQFTGPHAEELMARFTAPFHDWDAQENPTVWGVMEGVMVGRHH